MTRVVRQFIPATNTPAGVHLPPAGWWPVHHAFRMRIDPEDAPPRPGVLVRGMRVARRTQRWQRVLGV